MARSVIQSIQLTDFRRYPSAALEAGGRTVFLTGPNGAGKTNILEAISFLAPGRGLRGASVQDVGRRAPGEAQGRAWSVSALIEGPQESVRIGTGTESAAAPRRIVRIDGQPATPGRMGAFARPIWLTPAQD